ncbi:glutathione S-transferase family protein [Shewanella pealeana]|uniref:Putative glutathione S-transferase n=1 Tax=Shewanella pealeana (strain ATCC 700345 / ANG-SQ1) TaxID=398579 RepID=A8H1R3_SHEPA|nr:glutathione S-transferase family protein [Shewanella pealeana]ABV86500.1 putative glutathione S-transferase [Shewanella pealeana ATCC 700345]
MTSVKNSWNSSIKNGEYQRKESQFRNWITPDGSAGISGREGFKAEADRYHLYVSLACPWAHRTLVFRQLKGLENLITVSVVHPDMHDKGWSFKHDEASAQLYGTTGDDLYGDNFIGEKYLAQDPDYSGVNSVPILWDKKNNVIVNNESSEIIRMFNSAFNDISGNTLDFYPEHLRGKIDIENELVYHKINNGVYKTGFATTQEAYDKNVTALFAALEQLDQKLSTQRYLTGNELTEADWRLWVTLVRFDSVYHTHFKCNLKLIEQYNNIYHFMLELYQMPNIAKTVNQAHIKRHYYASHLAINPYGIVPISHKQDWTVAHTRDEQFS